MNPPENTLNWQRSSYRPKITPAIAPNVSMTCLIYGREGQWLTANMPIVSETFRP